jgi:HAD superfamily hydrolase (TIGR01549 family)
MSAVHRGIGAGTGELLDLVVGDRDRSGDDALSRSHQARYREHVEDLRAFEGVRELLQACRDDQRTVVLASSASDEELDELRAAIASDDLLHAVTGADDAEGAKPNPDIVEAALDKGGLSAADAVLVGDSVWDGHACRAAGVPFVGLTCGGTSDAELRAAGAVEVWRDPVALRAAWFGRA